MKQYKISQISELSGYSADTLRYYEKIGLLTQVERTPSGLRSYNEQNLSDLCFIQRAKAMNFTLEEIRQLLSMRKNPTEAKTEVRQLTKNKLNEVKASLQTLTTLHNELTLLVNLCSGSKNGCPIIEDIEKP